MSKFDVKKEADGYVREHMPDIELGSPSGAYWNLCSLLTRCQDATTLAERERCKNLASSIVAGS